MIIICSQGITQLQPIARCGDQHQCPQRSSAGPHKGGPILTGSSWVKINGRPASTVGDSAQCNGSTDKIQQGVNSITINGKPVTIQSSPCEHGGQVTTGSANVWVGPQQR